MYFGMMQKSDLSGFHDSLYLFLDFIPYVKKAELILIIESDTCKNRISKTKYIIQKIIRDIKIKGKLDF